MKNLHIIFVLVLALFFVSCHKDNPAIYSGDFNILSINSDTLAVGDTLIIKGEYFGVPSKDKFIYFDTLNRINSSECLLWQNFEIRLIIPKIAKSNYFKIVENNVILDSIFVKVSPVPFFDVVLIPSGKFVRGSSSNSVNEQPAKEITISKDFYMTKYELSQRVYETVSENNPSDVLNFSLPVSQVSWDDAVRFCNILSELHGLEKVYTITGVEVTMNISKNGWRLPTEAEWEYACRAGSKGDYSGTGQLDEMGWYGDNSGLKMHPSGRKRANDFGLYDTHGNLWEWCWDYYADNYYSESPITDPTGPATGKSRVMRGGSWNDGIYFARSSNRSLPLIQPVNTGIRLVRNK